ncbi:MAG TPA: asparagine synthase (glutamine-hydrolyzing) [Saprospiraceae bacterium]|nr:asparagine synthase (glutamine-hydrolyzing) [Saprospiraceae bacterium]
MCAIAAIIHQNNTVIQPTDINQMTDLARHRGPNGEGFYFGSNFALGHRRLAITDLSPEGSQPMVKDGYVICFNGEIYNYSSLRQQFEAKGIQFLSDSDTEVLLQTYIQYGQDCVDHLDGMWSFIIFDPIKNLLFCSRDHVGMKPFYYAIFDQKMYIASEIKQILPFLKKKTANPEAIVDYLSLGLEDHLEETFFSGIFKLLSGHNLIYDLSSHTVKKIRYSIFDHRNTFTESDPIALVQKNIAEAVRLRAKAQVPIGVMISGGLDSAVIGACLTNTKHTYAIHARSLDKSQDELDYAKDVAYHLHLDLKIHTPKIDNWKDAMDSTLRVQEEPFANLSVVLQHQLFQKVKKDGVKVLLDGQGADELFLGYRAYLFKMLKNYNIWQSYKIWQEQKLFIAHSRLKTILYYLYMHCRYLINFNSFIQKKFIHKGMHKYFLYKKALEKAGLGLNFPQWQAKEITQYQLPHLLKYEDKNAMSQGIETRLPYLSQSVVNLAMALPDDQKIRNGVTKFVLRKAFEKYLPSSIVWRKDKIGFGGPQNSFIIKNRSAIEAEINNSIFIQKILQPSTAINKLPNDKIFRLYCLARWSQLFDVKHIYT